MRQKLFGIMTIVAIMLALAFTACNDPEPAHVHQWGAWEVTTAANCTTTGSQTRTCVLDPTHTETEVIPINDDHDWGEWTGTVTCETAGTGTRVCSRNETHIETNNNLQPLGHAYNDEDWEVTEPSTCIAKGREEANCVRYAECGNTGTREIAINPTAHNWQLSPTATAPTCTEDGNGDQVCSYNHEHTQSGVIPKLGHDSGEWHTTLEPDCTTAGSRQLRCTRDNAVLNTETITALGHDDGAWHTTLEPNCTTAGSKELRCTRDNAVLNTESIIALGHDYQNYTQTTAPTCTTAGIETGTCTHDPTHKDTRAGAVALGHDYQNWQQTTASTCTTEGVETGTCTRDQVTATRPKAIDPTAHNWNNSYTVTTPATETANGIEAISCKHNAAHTKDPHTLWATGTAGLDFVLISINGGSNNAYRVHNKDTVNGTATGDIFIPAYHRSDANSAYLPITQISNGTDSESNNAFGGTYVPDSLNTTVTGITFAQESQLTTISNNAFGRCNSLTSITIPNSVTSIGNNAFQGCTNLRNIIIDNDKAITYNGNPFSSNNNWLNIFSANSADNLSVTFKKNVPNYAFYSSSANTRLTSVTILEGVTAIGNDAFYNCTGITSVTILEGVTAIGNDAFYKCTGITSITIPDSVTSIGQYAFSDCTGITSVIIPASVTFIGQQAFQYCTNLTSVTIEGTIAYADFGSNGGWSAQPIVLGDLHQKYFAGGGIGTYTRSGDGTNQSPYVWTKQP